MSMGIIHSLCTKASKFYPPQTIVTPLQAQLLVAIHLFDATVTLSSCCNGLCAVEQPVDEDDT